MSTSLPYTYADPEEPVVITFMSRMDDYRGTWQPEEDSRLHRAMCRIDKLAIHLKGNQSCATLTMGVVDRRRIMDHKTFGAAKYQRKCTWCLRAYNGRTNSGN